MGLVLRALGAGLVLILASPAAADEGDYQRIIKEALVEFEHGRWSEAYALFGQAHELVPNARTQRGMGMVSYELGEYPRALEHLEAALQSDERPLEAETRAEVRELIARIGRLVGTLDVTLEPPGALLLVNHERTKDRELKVSVGKVTLQAELAGYAAVTRVLNVAGGKRYPVDISLRPLATPGSDSSAPLHAPSQNDRADGSLWSSPWLWVAVGAVVVGGVVTAVVLSQGDDVPGEMLPEGNVGSTFTALVRR